MTGLTRFLVAALFLTGLPVATAGPALADSIDSDYPIDSDSPLGPFDGPDKPQPATPKPVAPTSDPPPVVYRPDYRQPQGLDPPFLPQPNSNPYPMSNPVSPYNPNNPGVPSNPHNPDTPFNPYNPNTPYLPYRPGG